MTNELVALLAGREVGRIFRDKRHGRLSFVYDDKWRNSRNPIPLSLSMPLAAAEHGHAVIDAFLWGLLPDNEIVLERWARKFQVSARNAYGLISNVGEDCAGAVQFVSPDRVNLYTDGSPVSVEWIDDHGVSQRLRALRDDQSAWRAPRDTGQFSLAGAQPKTALLFEDGRWGVPSGRTPTSHILKPPTGDFDGHAENEHFCLTLARRLGMPTASSSIMRFEDELAIVVERYDRRQTERGLVRIHQEDICQALAVLPTKKYENEGGPGASDIIELLRVHSGARDEDIETFVDALGLNWLIAGTDAHAKNYSVLIGVAGRARLAPLYDIASALPYQELDMQKLKLAMKIGRDYRLRDIGLREWKRFSASVHLDEDATIARLVDLAERISDEAVAVRDEITGQGITHPIVPRLAESISVRARACAKRLQIA